MRDCLNMWNASIYNPVRSPTSLDLSVVRTARTCLVRPFRPLSQCILIQHWPAQRPTCLANARPPLVIPRCLLHKEQVNHPSRVDHRIDPLGRSSSDNLIMWNISRRNTLSISISYFAPRHLLADSRYDNARATGLGVAALNHLPSGPPTIHPVITPPRLASIGVVA